MSKQGTRFTRVPDYLLGRKGELIVSMLMSARNKGRNDIPTCAYKCCDFTRGERTNPTMKRYAKRRERQQWKKEVCNY